MRPGDPIFAAWADATRALLDDRIRDLRTEARRLDRRGQHQAATQVLQRVANLDANRRDLDGSEKGDL